MFSHFQAIFKSTRNTNIKQYIVPQLLKIPKILYKIGPE